MVSALQLSCPSSRCARLEILGTAHLAEVKVRSMPLLDVTKFNMRYSVHSDHPLSWLFLSPHLEGLKSIQWKGGHRRTNATLLHRKEKQLNMGKILLCTGSRAV